MNNELLCILKYQIIPLQKLVRVQVGSVLIALKRI